MKERTRRSKNDESMEDDEEEGKCFARFLVSRSLRRRFDCSPLFWSLEARLSSLTTRDRKLSFYCCRGASVDVADTDTPRLFLQSAPSTVASDGGGAPAASASARAETALGRRSSPAERASWASRSLSEAAREEWAFFDASALGMETFGAVLLSCSPFLFFSSTEEKKR